GQDYLSAGMLDRAERIFLELVNARSHSAQAYRLLIDIYQQEKDWENAVQAALKYETVTRQTMQPVIAQYYCELADSYFHKSQYDLALDYVEKALKSDKSCARASLLKAKTLMAQQDYKLALYSLKQIKEQNPHYLSEAIDLLASCYEKLNQEDELVTYLKNLVEEYPRVPVVLILAERIRQWKGDKVAASFVGDYVRRYPSLRGLYLFVNIYISTVEGRAKEDLSILQKLMKKVLSSKPDYQCTSCGFAGKALHWQCPGCKQWSTVMPIHTLEEPA
ncbi:MAG: tetratricopeptide repeat protein, partial [Gammaproteobacteria bacterium]